MERDGRNRLLMQLLSICMLRVCRCLSEIIGDMLADEGL
jgi:hypothetical protein